MRDSEKTISGIADKAKTAIISYLDGEGFPVAKAMLAPREREGIRVF